VKTGALSRLFRILALEGLQFQLAAIIDATGEVFINGAVASGFDVVHAAADLVVATNLDFLGRVGGGIVLASPFVLEGFLAFGPGASQSALDLASAVVLDAAHDADAGLVSIDVALIGDAGVEVAVTIVQAFAVGDASGRLGHDLLATSLGAVEPVFADFEGITGGVLFAVFHASDLDQLAAIVDGFLALVDGVILVHFLLLGDTFSGVHAAFVGHSQEGFSAGGVLFAGIEVAAIVERFSGFVLLAVSQASSGIEAQVVSAGHALTTVVLVVEVAAESDLGQILGDAGLGDDFSALANVDETSTFNFGSFSVSARASSRWSGVLGVGESQSRRSCHKAQNDRTDLHDDQLNSRASKG